MYDFVFKTYSNQNIDDDFIEIILRNKLINLEPIVTTGNGYCLFNSISLILFGTEEYSKIIKLCTHFTLLDYQSFFRKYRKEKFYKKSFEYYIMKSLKKKEYANEVQIAAASLMLDRPIYVYSVDNGL